MIPHLYSTLIERLCFLPFYETKMRMSTKELMRYKGGWKVRASITRIITSFGNLVQATSAFVSFRFVSFLHMYFGQKYPKAMNVLETLRCICALWSRELSQITKTTRLRKLFRF